LKLFKYLLNNVDTVNYSDEEFQQCLNNASKENYPELVKSIITLVNFEFDYSIINYNSLTNLQTIESCVESKVDYRKAFLDSCLSEDKTFFDYCFSKISIDQELAQKAVYNVCSIDNNKDFAKYVLSVVCNDKTDVSVYNAGLLSACENGLLNIVEFILEYRPTNLDECINEIRCNLYDDNYIDIYNLLEYINKEGYDGYSDSDSDSDDL
jgi:hypothetical protein